MICPTCKARPGASCRTVNPRPNGSSTLKKGLPAATHQPRLTPVYEAWGRGYEEGQKER
ncbi:zinc finger domain-containing protein [Nesterenkonia massiliensis]|uniref:zinc finger domain-containing protein n=1 Tax=Nesterenkonia massiliensis TaxID=1232429 RepID=UPI003B8A733C